VSSDFGSESADRTPPNSSASVTVSAVASRLRAPVCHDQLRCSRPGTLQQLDQPGANEAVLTDRLIKLAAEGRAQLRLQVELSRALIDLNAVREFKGEVFYAIRQEGTAVASRILDTLKARRALRPSVDLATLDTLGGLDGVPPPG
jgi:hypothetical protein